MRYSDITFRKVMMVLLLTAVLVMGVVVAVQQWSRSVGTFSLTAVNYVIVDTAEAWWYRFEFALEQSFRSAVIYPSTRTAAAQTGTAESIPVLLYHGIVSPAEFPEDVTLETFKAQMFALKADGWQTVSIYDFVRAMEGKITLPPKSFLLTFDDGRKASYYPTDPVLQALGYRATMFVIAGHSIDDSNSTNPYYLSVSELQTMLRSEHWDLQSHSDIGHADYPIDAAGDTGSFYGNKLWVPDRAAGESSSTYAARLREDFLTYFLDEEHKPWPLAADHLESTTEYESRITTDLTTAKQEIENTFGVSVVSFAYPFSDYAQSTKTDFPASKSILVNTVNSVYPVSFYQWFPGDGYSQNYPALGGQLLKRIEPRNSWSGEYLASLLDEGEAKALPFQGGAAPAGWEGTWGTVSENNGSLWLAAGSSTNGAFAYMDGTALWENYRFTAQFNWGNNVASVVFAGHFEDDNGAVSYVQCNFAAGEARLEGKMGNATIPLAVAKNPAIGPGANDTAGIQFANGTAGCLWSGTVIARAPIPNALPQRGGIGAEVWGRTPGGASMTLFDISVASGTQPIQ